MGDVWLLDVELGGGRVLYVASEGAEVATHAAGGLRRYDPGLPDLTVERGAAGLNVDVRAHDIDGTRRRHGPFRGRRATLRLWRGEAVAEDAEVLFAGVIEDARWGDPEAPDRLQLDFAVAPAVTSAAVVAPDALVSTGAWPDLDPDAAGEPIPTVIGEPGTSSPIAWFDATRYAASPLLCVDTQYNPGISRLFAAADHHVSAANLRVYNANSQSWTSVAVVNQRDGLGRRVACVVLTTTFAGDGDEGKVFGSWDQGGGALHEGRAVRALGDLLVWGAVTYGGGPWDLGRIRGAQAAFNRYKIDAVINDDGLAWDAWLQANVLDVIGITVERGPDGSYFAEDVYLPDEARSRARLSTDPADTRGHRVTRVGPYADDVEDELASSVTVLFALSNDGRWPRSWTLTGDAEIDTEERRTTELYAPCRRALELGGAQRTVWAPTADPTTARLVALRQADRYSVPGYLGVFEGGPELGPRVARGDTVEVYDGGAVRWGVVRGVVLSVGRVVVSVRFV